MDAREIDIVRLTVRKLVGELTPMKGKSLAPEMSMKGDLGFESIGLMELGVAIEQELDIDLLGSPLARNLVTLSDLETAVLQIIQE